MYGTLGPLKVQSNPMLIMNRTESSVAVDACYYFYLHSYHSWCKSLTGLYLVVSEFKDTTWETFATGQALKSQHI